MQNFHIKMLQLGGFLGGHLGPLLKTGLSLIGNVRKALTKRILIPFGLAKIASAAEVEIHKKILGSGYLSELTKRTHKITNFKWRNG